jgi:hypothetical protein
MCSLAAASGCVGTPSLNKWFKRANAFLAWLRQINDSGLTECGCDAKAIAKGLPQAT